MKVAPKPRADGRCLVCPNLRRRPARGHKSALAAWERDPFCSTECARLFHGVTIPRSPKHGDDDLELKA